MMLMNGTWPIRAGLNRVALLCVIAISMGASVLAQTSSKTLVLEYIHIHHMLADRDPVPLLRVYTDGQVRVHYPAYMQRAGDYEFLLSPGELRGLLVALEADGLMELDIEASLVERRLEEVSRAANTASFVHVSDSTETLIRVSTSYLATGNVLRPLKTIRWNNVHSDTREFPDVTAVGVISLVEARLQDLLRRNGLGRLQ